MTWTCQKMLELSQVWQDQINADPDQKFEFKLIDWTTNQLSMANKTFE